MRHLSRLVAVLIAALSLLALLLLMGEQQENGDLEDEREESTPSHPGWADSRAARVDGRADAHSQKSEVDCDDDPCPGSTSALNRHFRPPGCWFGLPHSERRQWVALKYDSTATRVPTVCDASQCGVSGRGFSTLRVRADGG